MYKLKRLLRVLFTPVSIMLVPHADSRHINFRLPAIGIVLVFAFFLTGVSYVFSTAVKTFEYRQMEEKLSFYSGQFMELKSTISALKMAEAEFNQLFATGSREAVLDDLDTSDVGSIDLEVLKSQIRSTIEGVGEIKDYLSQTRDVYMATPKGWPAEGRLSSGYGWRTHPVSGRRDFHSALDIATKPGTPVRATADGIVSFSGYSGANGNLVVLEHGFGYSTFYAHNKKNAVKVGQVVKRGDIISYVGSTGTSTGPHVHYEIWKDGRAVNPYSFLEWKKFLAGNKLQESETFLSQRIHMEKGE